MKWLQYLLSGVLIFTLNGCDTDDGPGKNITVVGTGPVVTETLNLPPFHRIEHTGVANIIITLGSPQSVVLKAQQNIIDVLTWEVVDNTLKIGVQEKTSISVETTEDIRFEMVISEISDIGLLGVGSFDLSGDFQDELSVSLIGVGNIEAYDLEVGKCTILSTGVGDCRVRVRDELNVTITGVGNIYYKGNPTITQKITGIGNLIDDN